MSILNDVRLRQIGPEVIFPFSREYVQPASIDIHIDKYFYQGSKGFHEEPHVIDPRYSNDYHFGDLIRIGKDGVYFLPPGCFALASTFERVKIPPNITGRFEGKSSLARLGLLTHITAGFIDPGFEGHITLELCNLTNVPWTIVPGMKIGQLCLEELTEKALFPYGTENGSHYQNSGRGPIFSRSHVNFQVLDVYKE